MTEENKNTPEQPVNYFIGRVSGNLVGDVPTISKQLKNTQTEFGSRNSNWENKDVKDLYTKSYGDDAYNQFNKDYDTFQKEYNAVEFYKSDLKEVEDYQTEYIDPILKKRYNNDINLKVINADVTGSKMLIGKGVNSQQLKSLREVQLEKTHFINSKGEKQQSIVGGLSYFINNPNYKNDEGKMIKAMYYQDEASLRDEEGMIRSEVNPVALYYGEEIGNKEIISFFDAAGYTTPKLDGNIFSSIPRALLNTTYGLVGTISDLGLSQMDLMEGYIVKPIAKSMGANDKNINKALSPANYFREYLEGTSAAAKSMSISKSDASKKDLFTGENISSFIVEIAVQLLTGRALATVGFKIAELAGLGLKGAQNVAKYSSLVPLTLSATAGARDEAIAAGFTKEQAGAYQWTLLAAMFAVNKTFSWVDKGLDVSKTLNQATKLVSKNLAYDTKAIIAETGKELSDEAAKKQIGKAASLFKKVLSADNPEKGLNGLYNYVKKSGTAPDMIKEAFEETSETWSEYLVKGSANIVYGDKFMTTKDPNYWKQFWVETGMSAIGGAAGAGMMKAGQALFKSAARTSEDRNRMVDFILDGEDETFVKVINDQHKSQKLGSFDLSTVYDEKNKLFKNIKDAGEGAISQADANRQLILNEYNSIKTLISTLDPAKKQEIRNNPAYKDADFAFMAVDRTRKLVEEHLNLVLNNDLDEVTETVNKAILEGQVRSKKDAQKLSKIIASEYETTHKSTDGKTVKPETIEQLINVKKEIVAIKEGKANESFLLNKITGESESSKIFGDDFLFGLNETTFDHIDLSKDKINELNNNLSLNKELINEMSDDLINAGEIIRSLHKTTDGLPVIDESGKKLIKDKFDNFLNTFNKDLNVVKEKINKVEIPRILDSIEDNTSLKKFFEAKGFNEKQQKMVKKNLSAFVKAYYKVVNENLTIAALPSIKGINISKLNDIADFLDLDLDIDHMLLEDATIQSSVNNYINSPSATAKENLGDSPILGEDVRHLNTTNEDLNGYNESLKDADFEKTLAKWTDNQLIALIQGFKGDDFSGYEQTGSIQSQIELLEKFNVVVNGKSRFNKLKEATNLDNIINARIEQVNAIIKYSPLLVDYKLKTLQANEIRTGEQALEFLKETSDEDRDRLSLQLKSLGIDPNLLAIAEFNAKKGKLDLEGSELKKEFEKTIEKLRAVTEDLGNLNQRSKILLELAKKNQDNKNKLENEQNLITENIKNQVLDIADLVRTNSEFFDAALIQEVEKYYTSIFSVDNITAEDLNVDRQMLYKVFDAMYKLSDGKKKQLLHSVMSTMGLDVAGALDNMNVREEEEKGADGKIIPIPLNPRVKLLRTMLPAYIPYKKVNNQILEILEKSGEKGGVLTTEQEYAVMSVVAHTTSNITKDFNDFVKEKIPVGQGYMPQHLEDSMLIWGFAGTGKTTFCAGFGVSIAQKILSSRFNAKSTQVLMVSNNRDQVKSLNKTADEYKINLNPNTQGNGGLLFSELLEFLNSDKINNTSILVLDEATLAKYSNNSNESTLLTDVFKKVTAINRKRKESLQPPLKVIMMGDNSQNGYYEVGEDGGMDIKNIRSADSYIFGPAKLTTNFRAKIDAISAPGKVLKQYSPVAGFFNQLETQYGTLLNDELGTLVGVRVEKDTFLKDQEFADHIKHMIDSYKKAEPSKKFTVGVASEIDLEDSPILTLINDPNYKEHFKVETHRNIQGNEFDYMIVIADKASFGDMPTSGFPVGKEKMAARKLATSIERARYFSLVINNTNRDLRSVENANMVIPDEYFDKALVDGLKSFRRNISPDPDNIPLENVINKQADSAETIEETKVKTVEAQVAAEGTGSDLDIESLASLFGEDREALIDYIISDYNYDEETARKLVNDYFNTKEPVIENTKLEAENEEKAEDLKESVEQNSEEDKKEIVSDINSENTLNEAVKELLSEEFQDKTKEELVKDLENANDSEKKDLETAISVKEQEKLTEFKRLDELDETLNEELTRQFDNDSTEDDKDAKSVNLEFNKNGWLNMYSDSTYVSFDTLQKELGTAKYEGINFVDNKDDYERNLLEALNNKGNDFKYDLLLYKAPDNTPGVWDNVQMIATNKDGKSVIVGHMLTSFAQSDVRNHEGVEDTSNYGWSKVKSIFDKYKLEKNKLYKFSIDNSIVKTQLRRTSGSLKRSLVRQEAIKGVTQLNQQKKTNNIKFVNVEKQLKEQGVNICPVKFVCTSATSVNRGKVFVLYTWDKNQKWDDETVQRLITNPPDIYKLDDAPFKGFKNGFGSIYLDVEPFTVNELYNSYSSSKTTSLEQHNAVESVMQYGKANMALAFFGHIINSTGNLSSDDDYSIMNEFLGSYFKDNKSKLRPVDAKKLEEFVKLKLEDETSAVSIFINEILKPALVDTSLGDSKIVTNKNGKQNLVIDYKSLKNFISYIPKSKNEEIDPEHAKDLININLSSLFFDLEDRFYNENGKVKEVLDFLDELKDFFDTNPNALSKGIFLGFQSEYIAIKTNSDNKVFARVQESKELDEKLLCSVESVRKPMLRITGDTAITIVESSLEEKVEKTIKPDIGIKKKEKDLNLVKLQQAIENILANEESEEIVAQELEDLKDSYPDLITEIDEAIKNIKNKQTVTTEDVDDNFIKNLNSTWSVVENLLSLNLENSSSIDDFKNDLLKNLAETTTKINSEAVDMSVDHRSQVNSKEIEMKAKITNKMSEITELQNKINTTPAELATNENLVPICADGTSLSEDSKKVVSLLEANKHFYIGYINGAYSDEADIDTLTTKVLKLAEELMSLTSNTDLVEEINNYITKKVQEVSCKLK